MVRVVKVSCLLVVSAFIVLVLLYVFGKGVLDSGESNTQWIRIDMWPSKYFNPVNRGLSELDSFYLSSLSYDELGKSRLLKEISNRKCADSSEACSTVMLVLANTLIENGNYREARTVENIVAKNYYESGECPIKLELTLLKHAMSTVKALSPGKAAKRVDEVVSHLKKQKGMNTNLQIGACVEAAEKKPMMFHRYVMAVAEIMSYGNGEEFYSAAYLRNVNIIK